jgi:hypothetical protein
VPGIENPGEAKLTNLSHLSAKVRSKESMNTSKVTFGSTRELNREAVLRASDGLMHLATFSLSPTAWSERIRYWLLRRHALRRITYRVTSRFRWARVPSFSQVIA